MGKSYNSSSRESLKVEAQLAHGGGLPFFLQRRIQFREAIGDDSAVAGSFSYSTLGKRKQTIETSVDENGFCQVNQELFPNERVREMMKWEKILAVGPGLTNLGNTCFLNSVLQCLTYTPPLANYLLGGEHGKKCRVEGFCLVCELERHLKKALGGVERQSVISPNGTVAHLKWIAKHMRVGRQEDSHEFLRFMIEGMQRNLLSGLDVTKMDGRLKETTLIHQIFGGYLQSRIKCLTCQHVSSTFDPLLDLSLEVRQADSIEKALHQFIQPERLAKSNRYRCEHCKKLSDADKAMSIYRPPNVLTIHLKRFQMSPYGETTKINKHIDFKSEIDLVKFVTGEKSGGGGGERGKEHGMNYDLYAVLVHEGHSCNSGHYHSFIKSSNGIWYSMNDSSVHQVGLNTVLKQRAYILFYARRLKKALERTCLVASPPTTSSKEKMMMTPSPLLKETQVNDKKIKSSKDTADHSSLPSESLVKEGGGGRQLLAKQTQKVNTKEDLPTPPATPEPVLGGVVKQVDSIFLDPFSVVSNSMWHLTKTGNFKLTDFSSSSNLGECQTRPHTLWTIKSFSQ